MVSSAMPTSEMPLYERSSPRSVASIVTRSVSKVRRGNGITWPGTSRELWSRATATGFSSSPSKVNDTSVMVRFLPPWTCSSRTWSAVTGSSRRSSR